VTDSGNYQLRDYRIDEAELACDIRGMSEPVARNAFIDRLAKPGQWAGHYRHLALTYNEILVGDIQLRHCPETMPPGAAHIGIDIAETYRGKGAGTLALRLAWEWAKANGFHRVEGSTDESNIAMQKAFEKAGWHFEGRQKKLFMSDGIGHDYLSYALTI